MIILTHGGGIASTNCFAIADETTGQAVLFDAPDHTVEPLLDELQKRNLKVVGLWLTHGHFDHVADHEVVTRRFPEARVLIHPLDEPKLQNPRATMFALPFVIPPRSADGHVHDGDTLRFGPFEVEVIHTPGHAPGHVMYYFAKEGILVGGDLIIMDAIGRTDLPDSDHAALERSVRRIMQLPDETKLLPGHGEVTTLGEQREVNRYVQQILREA